MGGMGAEAAPRQNHSTDTKNNRHLIEFLRSKSNSFNAFADNKMNVDLMTTWANFFELLSILRNVVAHQGTVITNDTLNEIKSKSRDIFERYFEVTWDTTGDKHISPKENGIVSLIGVMNDFVVNTVKFINGEKDFKFIGLISL